MHFGMMLYLSVCREKVQTEQSEVAATKTALKREQNEALAQTTQRINSAVHGQGQLKHEASW